MPKNKIKERKKKTWPSFEQKYQRKYGKHNPITHTNTQRGEGDLEVQVEEAGERQRGGGTKSNTGSKCAHPAQPGFRNVLSQCFLLLLLSTLTHIHTTHTHHTHTHTHNTHTPQHTHTRSSATKRDNLFKGNGKFWRFASALSLSFFCSLSLWFVLHKLENGTS